MAKLGQRVVLGRQGNDTGGNTWWKENECVGGPVCLFIFYFIYKNICSFYQFLITIIQVLPGSIINGNCWRTSLIVVLHLWNTLPRMVYSKEGL